MATMHKLMESLRENRPQEIAGLAVTRFSDYLASRSVDMRTGAETVLTLPKSNVLVFGLEDGAGVIVRPSGTEPKIKAYVTATGTDKAAAEAMAERLTDAAKELLKA